MASPHVVLACKTVPYTAGFEMLLFEIKFELQPLSASWLHRYVGSAKSPNLSLLNRTGRRSWHPTCELPTRISIGLLVINFITFLEKDHKNNAYLDVLQYDNDSRDMWYDNYMQVFIQAAVS